MQQDARTRWLCENVRLITTYIVEDASAIQVDACEISPGRVTVQVSVSSDEIGKLIGRDGRMAEALRGYIKAYEKKHGGRYGLAIQRR